MNAGGDGNGSVFPGRGLIRISNRGLAGPGLVSREEELSRLDEFDAREKQRRPNARNNEHECNNNRNNNHSKQQQQKLTIRHLFQILIMLL